MDRKITVYYDGMCNLCAGAMEKVSASSRGDTFEHVDISSESALPGVSHVEAMRDVHVRDENGHMYKGIDAILRIFDEYPHLRWLATLGRLRGFYMLGRGVYRIVEKTRYFFFGRRK